jgi:hypothetical protein
MPRKNTAATHPAVRAFLEGIRDLGDSKEVREDFV